MLGFAAATGRRAQEHLVKVSVCFYSLCMPASSSSLSLSTFPALSGTSALCSCNQNTQGTNGKVRTCLHPHLQPDMHVKHQGDAVKPSPEARLTFQTKLSAISTNVQLLFAQQETSAKCIARLCTNMLTDKLWPRLKIWYFPLNKYSSAIPVMQKNKQPQIIFV